MPTKTRQWLVNGCPRGRPLEAGDFRLVETEIGDPAPGQMLLATRWLGFDPAQKGWMENIADYVAPLTIGDEVLIEGTGAYTTTYSAVAFNGFEPLRSYVI